MLYPKHGTKAMPFVCAALITTFASASASADETDPFSDTVRPYVQKYCVRCHNSREAKGELNLTAYASADDVTDHFRRWNNIVEFIRSGEMPPDDAPQPEINESNAAVAAVDKILQVEARRNAGDPGVVLPRRLSNTEYNLSIRDLTGVDIRPTKDFPADPAGGEGFDNTGEVLGMSPNLVRKYLSAAQLVADHLVLKPDGIVFAPFPVTSYNERKNLTEQAIIDFYISHEIRLEDYLDAAWRYQHLPEIGRVTPERWAQTRGLSPKYFNLVSATLSDAKSQSGLLRRLHELWRALRAPQGDSDRPAELIQLAEFIDFGRRVLGQPRQDLIRSNAGNWPISHLDFRTRVAEARDRFNADRLKKKTLITAFRVPTPKTKTTESVSFFLRVDPAFAELNGSVRIDDAVFSRADRLPANEKDVEKQGVRTLRSVLEKFQPELATSIGFGRRIADLEIDPDSFVLQSPSVLEISLTPEMQEELQGLRLLLPLELLSGSSGVIVSHGSGHLPKSEQGSTAELLVDRDSPAAAQLAMDAEVFCRTFPDRFFYVNEKRGLAAGFHLVEGFFRDDRPLVNSVLSVDEAAKLNALWRDLDFVTQSAETLIRGFVWFERSERHVLHDKRFDFLRPQDPRLVQYSMSPADATENASNVSFPLLDRFEKAYLDKLGVRRVDDSLAAVKPDDKYRMIHGFFEGIRHGLQLYDKHMDAAETRALQQMNVLAARAFRRPLRTKESASFQTLYRTLRNNGQNVEGSLRGVLTAILMSPEFCFRYRDAPEGNAISPLTDSDLASRLSYFLWSSLPDEELLDAASAQRLHTDEQLKDQLRRMLRDDRIEAFAREFFGQWLRYRSYLTNDPINAAAFPGYDDELRTAIAEEPVRLATWMIQNDAPVTMLLNSDATFLNDRLAKHYGGSLEKTFRTVAAEHHRAFFPNASARRAGTVGSDPAEGWHRVTGLRHAGRGGLFGMAVVLATNSAGERTSPVKRGFWTVHHLLGQHFPPPPADVPELPTSEKSADKTIRELLAAHVEDAKCSICHRHFDSLGLTMEGFDPVGRSRTADAAGRKIDNVVQLPGGDSHEGVSGLIDYIERYRKPDFIRTLCRRFLGYALGRSVQLSDQPLLQKMELQLRERGDTFSALFETVVLSPQFRMQRGRQHLTEQQSSRSGSTQ